jgi:hypothetical protein
MHIDLRKRIRQRYILFIQGIISRPPTAMIAVLFSSALLVLSAKNSNKPNCENIQI